MSLHCFFGVELQPNGSPVTPPLPPKSVLVITHCALTSAQPGIVTLYAQSHDQVTRFAICTLGADVGIFYVPLQHIFAGGISFTLISSASGAASQCPAVHLTGYFESDEESYTPDGGESDDSANVPKKGPTTARDDYSSGSDAGDRSGSERKIGRVDSRKRNQGKQGSNRSKTNSKRGKQSKH
ncbi:hypothetical protein ERJ75_000751400 [Trypanosoma vivax]|uniref:Nucleoplasmin-like domain-containing protein n=1 Tax=Trypanosoma vivax (strain Y486) TaxID=1055687 RepID=G0U058_TRYVY|nr:hypothetical protein TRVL_02583 [Trypanosoma vivax]KAH8614065.1 hypothetical protein ERJ75_000751400 [Trypanosoma vivax]CCC49455.1 conserved hypothetical protein [Trypanosoma vivax Y486]